MASIKLDRKTGHILAGSSGAAGLSMAHVLVQLAVDGMRRYAATFTDLVDNSSGSADAEFDVAEVNDNLANEADAGTTSAQKAAAEAVAGTIKDALVELFARSNALAAACGVPLVTYNGGGTAADGTIAAIDPTVTAATTGIQATQANTFVAAVNDAIYTLGIQVNQIARALQVSELDLSAFTASESAWSSTIAAISTSLGTAADPAVAASAWDAKVVAITDNIATIAARLNAMTGSVSAPTVVAF